MTIQTRQVSLPPYVDSPEYMQRLLSSLTEELQRVNRRLTLIENSLGLQEGLASTNTNGAVDTYITGVYQDPAYWMD